MKVASSAAPDGGGDDDERLMLICQCLRIIIYAWSASVVPNSNFKDKEVHLVPASVSSSTCQKGAVHESAKLCVSESYIEPNAAAALASSHSVPGSLTLPDAAIATPMSLAQSRYVKTVEGKYTWTKTRKQPKASYILVWQARKRLMRAEFESKFVVSSL